MPLGSHGTNSRKRAWAAFSAHAGGAIPVTIAATRIKQLRTKVVVGFIAVSFLLTQVFSNDPVVNEPVKRVYRKPWVKPDNV
jgi:hypothetical protein